MTLSEMVMSIILLVAVAGLVMAKSQLLNTSHENGKRSPTDAFCSVLYLMAILDEREREMSNVELPLNWRYGRKVIGTNTQKEAIATQ